MQVYAYLQEHSLDGISDLVPAYQSLVIYFDETVLTRKAKDIENMLKQSVNTALQSNAVKTNTSAVLEIPVCYDEAFALDMQKVCEETGKSAAEIIQLHTGNTYEIMMMGFVPGFPYMGILPSELNTKRKATPRQAVPPGSVAIAGNQTGIYPLATPGGWNIIGRTPLPLIQLHQQPNFLFTPAQKIVFKSISRTSFDAYVQHTSQTNPLN